MKRFVKNSVLAMLVICFLLNIINLVSLIFDYYIKTPLIAELAKEVAQEIQSSEDVYQALAQFYYSGKGSKNEIQAGILGGSIILGIIVGIMIELEKKAKLKMVLEYIVGFLLVVISVIQYNLAQNTNFFEDALNNIGMIWICYTVIYAIVYIVKIWVRNKEIKKLNEILNKKSK